VTHRKQFNQTAMVPGGRICMCSGNIPGTTVLAPRGPEAPERAIVLVLKHALTCTVLGSPKKLQAMTGPCISKDVHSQIGL
jgi:hypothetical protein